MKTNKALGQPVVGAPRSAHRKQWVLTPEAFRILLAALHENQEQAGIQYVRIYQRLGKFFECRGCATPQELADETMNRVAGKLAAGEPIQSGQLIPYFYGVARNVLREYFVQPERKSQPLADLLACAHPWEDPNERREQMTRRQEKERLLELLSRLMQQLPVSSRTLLLAYEWGEKHARIEHRKLLATQLGITKNALKIRVFRVRASLEKRLLAQTTQP